MIVGSPWVVTALSRSNADHPGDVNFMSRPKLAGVSSNTLDLFPLAMMHNLGPAVLGSQGRQDHITSLQLRATQLLKLTKLYSGISSWFFEQGIKTRLTFLALPCVFRIARDGYYLPLLLKYWIRIGGDRDKRCLDAMGAVIFLWQVNETR
jgi:hypothetical protein